MAFCLYTKLFFILFDEQIKDLNGVAEHGLFLFSVNFEGMVFEELSQIEFGHGGERVGWTLEGFLLFLKFAQWGFAWLWHDEG